MEGIDLDSILDEDEINLFNDTGDDKDPDPDVNKEDSNPNKNDDDNGDKGDKEKDTTEVDPNTLFGDGVPENVGGEEDNKDKDEDPNSDKGGDSPKANFFSSVADTLAEEGVFPRP